MLQPGESIDIWVIEKALGSGGMGSVYRCHNRSAKRILAAIKVLDSNLSKYPEAQARFVREAEILFQLDHPNIVKVRNVRTDANPPYLEMEFVKGQSLEDRLRKGPFQVTNALHLMDQISSALAYLHRVGVRHRDIKPANLLIDSEGKIKLVDFGLAMEADTTRITQQGMTFGTVSYAPPEWIAPDTMDPAKWDLYSVGVVFYEVLTGRLAFPVSGQGSARQQAMQVIVGKQGHEPLDPGDEFDDELRALVRGLTHSDPKQRIGTASESVRRARKLLRQSEAKRGVTLAPDMVESWDDGLDRTPQPAKPRNPTWSPEESSHQSPLSRLETAPAPAPRTNTPIRALHTTHDEPSSGVSLPSRSGLLSGGLVFLTLLFAAVVAASVVAYDYFADNFRPRPVNLVVSGLPSGTPVGVRIGDLEPSGREGDWEFVFDEVPTGDAVVTWIMGDRCQIDDCPGEQCPGWCSTGTSKEIIELGEGPQTLTLPLTPPSPRRVRLNLPEATGDWTVQAKLDRQAGRRVEGGVIFDDVLPGRYTLRVYIGTCSPQLQGCWSTNSCTDKCTSVIDKVVVPVGENEWAYTSSVRSPTKTKTAQTSPKPTSAPQPQPQPQPTVSPKPSPSGTSAVTVGAFSAWLQTQPDWHAGAATANGRAKGQYLAGWSGASPPSSIRSSHAVTGVSWYAAAAYCSRQGGLLDADSAPTQWTPSPTAPVGEFRQTAGRPIWRSDTGVVIDKVDPADVTINTGFRCAK